MADLHFLKGKCQGLSFEGRGIVKIPGNVIFVDGLLPDEEADIEIIYKRAGNYYGRVKRLYNLSPARIKPLCGVATACGGCQFQNYQYRAQLDFKRGIVQYALSREFNKTFVVNDVVGMDSPFFYRNKIIKPIGLDSHGHLISGFYRNKTHEIVANKECVIEAKNATKVIDFVILLMNKYQIKPYDEKLKSGIIRYLFVRYCFNSEETMLVIVTHKKDFKNKEKFFGELVKNYDLKLTSIIQNINDKDTNVVLGEKDCLIFGRKFIYDQLLGLTFKIDAKSFYQVNPVMTEKLYSKAIELAKIKNSDTVLDAYSGIGTISLIASKHAKKIIGVELVKEAHLNSIENAELNKINNVQFVNMDATEYIRNENLKEKIDVLIMDPPRKGSTSEFIEAVIKRKIPTVIYISCNPFSLARDLKIFSEFYEIKEIAPFDMFPMTYHVETVISLILKK